MPLPPHILSPQIAQKAREIAQAIQPPPMPRATGYLAVSNGKPPAGPQPVAKGGKVTPFDPRGVMPPRSKAAQAEHDRPYDPRTLGGAALQALGAVSKLGPEWQTFAQGVQRGLDAKIPVPIPNYAPPAQDVQPLPKNKRGNMLIALSPADLATVTNDAGRRVYDDAGKKLPRPGGYLESGRSGTQTAERRRGDTSMQDLDPWGSKVLEQTYGPHLKAAQENYSYEEERRARARGEAYDPFPPGYFDGVSREAEANIRAGVKDQLERAKGGGVPYLRGGMI